MARTQKKQFTERFWIQLLDSGQELTASEQSVCLKILKDGKAVDIEFAEKELPKAQFIGLVTEGDSIVGVGAIKRIRKGYASTVNEKSGYEFDEAIAELGYVAVQKQCEGNGISKAIIRELLECFSGELFATTYDARMARTLTRYGFCKRGRYWRNEDNTADLSLYLNVRH